MKENKTTGYKLIIGSVPV